MDCSSKTSVANLIKKVYQLIRYIKNKNKWAYKLLNKESTSNKSK
jgi:hypothetical protein